MFCLLVLKESMGVNRVSHTGNSRVSFSLKQLGKGHKMEDFESQTSELSFGIPCASKVNDVREIQENEVCTICVWTWYAILIQFSNLGVRVLMGLWSCIFFFFCQWNVCFSIESHRYFLHKKAGSASWTLEHRVWVQRAWVQIQPSCLLAM